MQLVFVALWRRTALQIADIAFIVGNNQCPFKLAGVSGVDAKIGGKFHRAANALGNINKRTVGKNCRIQAGKKIVGIGNNAAEVFFDQLRMFFDSLGNRTENNPLFGQPRPVGRGDRNAVKNGVHRNDPGQNFLLFERDSELFIGIQKLRINLVQTLGSIGLLFGGGIVKQILIIYLVIGKLGPSRFAHCLPKLKSLQPPFQQPAGFAFFLRDQADNFGIEPLGNRFRLNVGYKTIFVLVAAFVNYLRFGSIHVPLPL